MPETPPDPQLVVDALLKGRQASEATASIEPDGSLIHGTN